MSSGKIGERDVRKRLHGRLFNQWATISHAVVDKRVDPGTLSRVLQAFIDPLMIHDAHDALEQIVALKALAGEAVMVKAVPVVREYQPSESEVAARAIMGKNMFGIADAIKYYEVAPTEKELAKLADIPFSEATLRACANTHVLCADFGLSVMDVWEKHSQLFFSKSDPWYGKKDEAKWARKRVKAQWRLLRKDVVPNSFGKDFRNQESLLGKGEKVPAVREMVYMVIGYYLATGEKLFPNYYVRTKSLSGAGSRVNVGYFDSGGLSISYWLDDPYYVGVASSGSSL
jgi:hypothetical protein